MYDVYVNVNSRPPGADSPSPPARGRPPACGAPLLEPPPAFALDAVDLGQHGVDVLLLLQQLARRSASSLQELRELRPLVRGVS